MKIGEFAIRSFVEQPFKLDGGTMFGVVPKALWQRAVPADENNLIDMVTNLFVLEAHGKRMLFDAGLGDTLSDRECKVYGIDRPGSLEHGLAGLDLKPHDIDYVILTHLHTDHAAGAVKLLDGEFVPRFPNAQYLVSKREWEVATDPNERTAAVYAPERYYALKNSGKLRIIEPDLDLFPGIRAVHTGGHTEGHFALEIESAGQKLVYYADLFPSSAHLPVAYIPATDVYPLESMEVKRRVLPRLVDEEIIVAFDHDTTMPLARIVRDGKKYRAEPAITAPSHS
ncbi:MBL fold metallo-hydrolase [candidate division GN15 bacterium]|nr:MBL fold metallo-hydrolase [candidate division GN15 bacterium]